MTPRPTAAQTRRYVGHVLYEVWMAGGLVARVLYHGQILADPAAAASLRSELEEIGRNADVESFVVHARGLTDFFYSDKRTKQLAIAADYFEADDEWKELRPVKSDALRAIPGRAGSEVTHLGYRRTTPSRNWDYLTIWRDLVPLVRLFVDNASPDRLGHEIADHARALLVHLEREVRRQLPAPAAAPTWSTAPTLHVPADWPGPGWTVVGSGGTATILPAEPFIPTGD